MKVLRRLLPSLLVLGFGMPAAAQQQQGASLGERVDLSGKPVATSNLRLSQSQGEPLATAGTTPLRDSLGGTLPTARRSMLWAVHPRSGVGVGFGVEQRDSLANANAAGAAGSQPQRPGAMLMGVSMDTGERSQVYMQTPLMSRDPNGNMPAGFDQQQPRELRMGLVFNTKSQVAELRKGLRMELSGQTTLTLKPRGGRIGVAFQKIW